jgi:hypothetical protein
LFNTSAVGDVQLSWLIIPEIEFEKRIYDDPLFCTAISNWAKTPATKERVMKNETTLIIGANSEIAKAIAQKIVNDEKPNLIVISRDTSYYNQPMFANTITIAVDNYLEEEISEAIKCVDSLSTNKQITRVFICHGVLHNQSCQPENGGF